MSNKIFKRLIEKRFNECLSAFGSIIVKGPRSVGKTTLCQQYANTSFFLSNNTELSNVKSNPQKIIQNSQKPILFDEWQMFPNILTNLKLFVDQNQQRGVGLLIGSLWLGFDDVYDPGIGRFCTIQLNPLSLFESEQSLEIVSLEKLIVNNYFPEITVHNSWNLEKLVEIVCRGGFPLCLNANLSEALLINQSYVTEIINFLASSNKVSFNKRMIRDLIDYCAIINGQIPNWSNLKKNELIGVKISRTTIDKYVDILGKLFLIDFLPAYSSNLSSLKRLTIKPKMYFCDPAIALGKLGFTPSQIMPNLNSFGFYFENLVYRDLKIYADYLNAKLFYYRDTNGNEVDFLMEFNDGTHIAIEVKLESDSLVIEKAAKSLVNYKKMCHRMELKAQNSKLNWNPLRKWVPTKLIVIVGIGNKSFRLSFKDEEIYVVPLQFLKP